MDFFSDKTRQNHNLTKSINTEYTYQTKTSLKFKVIISLHISIKIRETNLQIYGGMIVEN